MVGKSQKLVVKVLLISVFSFGFHNTKLKPVVTETVVLTAVGAAVATYMVKKLYDYCYRTTEKTLSQTEKREFFFPKPTGKYLVGTSDHFLKDTSRLESHGEKASKKVEGVSLDLRKLMIKLWYPADRDEKTDENKVAKYSQEIIDNFTKMLTDDGNDPEKIKQLQNIYTHSIPGRPISKDQKQFPLLIFGHGFGMTRSDYTSFCEELASSGYIVATVEHTYVSDLTRFPDGSVTELKRIKNIESFEEAVMDIEFMLDSCMQGKLGEICDKIDFKRIGILGHSLGGISSNQLWHHDERIKVGISLDGPCFGRNAMDARNKPFMFILGNTYFTMFDTPEFESFEKDFEMTRKEYQISLDVFYENMRKAGNQNFYRVTFRKAMHNAFSDYVIMTQFLKDLFNSDNINLDTGSITVDEMQDIYKYILAFFDVYLKSSTDLSQLALLKNAKYAKNKLEGAEEKIEGKKDK